ncbi:MAG: hypothetical protein M1813_004757 [Trichoglossum hirsutum]|nr:MAG: hypothetical protein M1813_004757 [Trichoglossum hirsutum]
MSTNSDDNMAALLYQGREQDHSDTSSFGTSLQSNNGNAGRATYFSADAKSKTAVYASTPTGSKHAARIQKICGHVHANAIKDPPSSPARKAIQYRSGQARILPSSPTVVEAPTITPITEIQATPSLTRQDHHHQQSWPTAAAVATPSPARTSVRVTRYDDGGQLAYHSKSDRAELYVSAPQGSQEAMMFDEIARRSIASSGATGRIVEQEEQPLPKQQQQQQQVVRRGRGWRWF